MTLLQSSFADNKLRQKNLIFFKFIQYLKSKILILFLILKGEKKMHKYVIMGVQGSGKGKQASLLKDNFDLVHINVGDIFRWNIQPSLIFMFWKA